MTEPHRLIVHVDAPQGTPVTHKRTGPTIEDAAGLTVFLAAGTDEAPETAALAISVVNEPSGGAYINIVAQGEVLWRSQATTRRGETIIEVIPTARQRPDTPADDTQVAPVGSGDKR